MPDKPISKRIWELDFFRGLALVFMIYFHLIYDMKEFFGYEVNYEGNLVDYIGKLSAILFILISGIASSLSRSNAKRGMKVLGAALLITLGSYLYDKEFFVVFGILHFLGLSMLLSVLFKKINNYILLAAGFAIMAIGYFVPLDTFSNDYLMILGFHSQGFRSSDYYPLFPYLGMFLIGIVLGKTIYAKKESLISPFPGHQILGTAGRHSLLVYLLHQPLIILVLYLISNL